MPNTFSILCRTSCFMWTYSTFKQFITHSFRIFNQTWQKSYGVTVRHLFLKVRIWIKLRKISAKILKKIQKNNTDVYLWAYSFQCPSMMFWVNSNQKDFVTKIKIIWCDTVLGYFNGQLLWHPWEGEDPLQEDCTVLAMYC